MMYLIFYDISDNKLRKKVSDLLLQEGYERLQRSVFLSMDTPVKNKKLIETINKITQTEKERNICILPVAVSNVKKMQIIGKHDWDIDYIIGSVKSFFIP